MIAALLSSRLFAFGLSVAGALLLAAGGLRWFAPTAGPPEGGGLGDLEWVETLRVDDGHPAARSAPLARDAGTLYRLAVTAEVQRSDGTPMDTNLLVTATEPPRLQLGEAAPAFLGVSSPNLSVYSLPAGTGPLDPLSVALHLGDATGEATVQVWKRDPNPRGPMAAAPLWFPGGVLLALGIALSVARGRAVSMTAAQAFAARVHMACKRLERGEETAGSEALRGALVRARAEADALARVIDALTAKLPEREERAALERSIGACGYALEGLVSTLEGLAGSEPGPASTTVEQAVQRGAAARASALLDEDL